MKFQVPQFIEVEDKIFGPLTLKQFIYLAGGVGVSVILYFALPIYLSIIPILFFLSFGIALAFYKVNSKPFISFLESLFMYMFQPKLYIWKQEQKVAASENITASSTKLKDDTIITDEKPATNFIPKLSESKLRDMTWNLDTRSSLNAEENGTDQTDKN